MSSSLRIFLFLFGFFVGGAFAGLATGWSSFFRLIGIFVILRLAESSVPRWTLFGRVGFLFGIFVEAFKVGS